ncbi:MAG: right-handed parallel beta-helix repeat-containing protein [Candidatus Bathyarchaeota archaeon]|nr:right-handed parallel beta-helix repeat-containing protein [Candidatus Bathyarchaeota archaeon]
MKNYFVVCLTALLFLVSFIQATSIVDAEDHETISADTIQGLIDSASSGDTVNIPAGYYTGGIKINKSISLIGQGKSVTVIDANFIGNAIVITSRNVEISGFTIKNSPKGSPAIYASNQPNISINSNNILDNAGGILLESCSYAKIQNNYFYHNNAMANGAAGFSYCNSVEFSNNTVRKNAAIGASFTQCQGCIIQYNQITDNNEVLSGNPIVPSGLGIWHSSNMTISYNNVTNNGAHGISGTGMSSSKVFKNYLIGNSIGLSDSGWSATGNRVYENVIQSNNQGFYLQQTSNNLFYHNDMINNVENIASIPIEGVKIGANTWDNGYPSGGNYWDTYKGTDSNNDGIGDTPYVIDSDNHDSYPLMKPYTASVSTSTTNVTSTATGGSGSSSVSTPKPTVKPTAPATPTSASYSIAPTVTPKNSVSDNSLIPLSTAIPIACLLVSTIVSIGLVLSSKDIRGQANYATRPRVYNATNVYHQTPLYQTPVNQPYNNYHRYPYYNQPVNYQCPYCGVLLGQNQRVCHHCHTRFW